MPVELAPELLLHAYQVGVFPMADPDEDGAIYWYRPERRGLLPLDDFHVPGNLAKRVRQAPFEVAYDYAFREVMEACADRTTTWISDEIIHAYTELHEMGFAHSVECWQDGELVGGLYGVALGGAFFGESMFHRVTDASKVALVHLVRRLRAGGFSLLDTQYYTEHLAQFGCVEVDRATYEARLAHALATDGRWHVASTSPANL